MPKKSHYNKNVKIVDEQHEEPTKEEKKNKPKTSKTNQTPQQGMADLNNQHLDVKFSEFNKIHQYIQENDTENLKQILKSGGNIFAKNEDGQTAYDCAKSKEDESCYQIIQDHMFETMCFANDKFFDLERSRHSNVTTQIHQLITALTQNKNEALSIELENEWARSVIFTISSIYKIAFAKANSSLHFLKQFYKTQAPNLGPVKPGQIKLKYLGTELNFILNPFGNQIANFFLKAIKSYGTNSPEDILSKINQLIGNEDKKEREQKLAALILNAFSKAKPITAGVLSKTFGVAKNKAPEWITFLHHLSFLLLQETQRRLYPYITSKHAYKTEQPLPMGICVAMALELVASGELSFNDILSKGSENYGPFTSSGINSEGAIEFKKKMEQLIVKYFSTSVQTFSAESLHKLLIKVYNKNVHAADEYESDEDDYDHELKPHENKTPDKSVRLVDILTNQTTYDCKQFLNTKMPKISDDELKTALNFAIKQQLTDKVALILTHKIDSISFDLMNALLAKAEKTQNLLLIAIVKFYKDVLEEMEPSQTSSVKTAACSNAKEKTLEAHLLNEQKSTSVDTLTSATQKHSFFCSSAALPSAGGKAKKTQNGSRK